MDKEIQDLADEYRHLTDMIQTFPGNTIRRYQEKRKRNTIAICVSIVVVILIIIIVAYIRTHF